MCVTFNTLQWKNQLMHVLATERHGACRDGTFLQCHFALSLAENLL